MGGGPAGDTDERGEAASRAGGSGGFRNLLRRLELFLRGLFWLAIGLAVMGLAVQRLGFENADRRIFVVTYPMVVFGFGAVVSSLIADDRAGFDRKKRTAGFYSGSLGLLMLPIVALLTFSVRPSNVGGIAMIVFTSLLFVPTAAFGFLSARASGDERVRRRRAGGYWIFMIFTGAAGIGLTVLVPANVVLGQDVSNPLMLVVLLPIVLFGFGWLYLALVSARRLGTVWQSLELLDT